MARLRSHPEYVALAVSLLAWIAIIAVHGDGPDEGDSGMAAMHTMSGTHSMAEMHGAGADPGAAGGLWSLWFGLPIWALMSVAMMIPAVVPAIRRVARNSLRRRRQRAIAVFLLPYLTLWTAFGLVVLPVLAGLDQVMPRWPLIAGAVGLALAWPLLPAFVRFRRACHRTVPLPPVGWRAEAGCARFGLRHGLACIGVCGPLMLVMATLLAVEPVWMLVSMVVLSGLVLLQKLWPRRRPDQPLIRARAWASSRWAASSRSTGSTTAS